jgi:hypothetical protein
MNHGKMIIGSVTKKEDDKYIVQTNDELIECVDVYDESINRLFGYDNFIREDMLDKKVLVECFENDINIIVAAAC